MGYEFLIASADGRWAPHPVAAETFLQRLDDNGALGRVVVTFTAPDTCELRTSATTSGMPDAVVRIEAAGFYLLDNSRNTVTRLLLSELVAYALGRCDAVLVREL